MKTVIDEAGSTGAQSGERGEAWAAFQSNPRRHELVGKLSDAQQRVLEFLLAGLTEPQIAEKIHRSRHTVHDHTKAIYAACGVKRRVHLVNLFTGANAHDKPAAPVQVHPRRDEMLGKLSEAQQRVLGYLLLGLTEPQIAEKVHRSRHTVHDHTKAIYAACGVKRRVHLVNLFMGIDAEKLASGAVRA